MDKVAYLGPEGSYSWLAASALVKGAALLPCNGFAAAVGALTSAIADGAVLPIENSLNGGIMQVMDLLQATQGICAVKSAAVRIDHRLVTLKGADLKDIKKIYSHEQALEQCAEYLYKNFPKASLCAAPSTSAALEMLKDGSCACIAGAHTKGENFCLSPENIADEKNNFTTFLLIRRGEVPPRGEKLYFSFTCRHEAGALASMLQVVSRHGINLTKIESRPLRERTGEYRFFAECEADYSSANVKDMLRELEEGANSLKILGVY